MSNKEIFYNMFFRQKPPSILRLACIQLIKEGVNFKDIDNWGKTWNLIWDRAEFILNKVHKSKEPKYLYRELINARSL